MPRLSRRRLLDLSPPEALATALEAAECEFMAEYRLLYRKALGYVRKKLPNEEDPEALVMHAMTDLWLSCYADGRTPRSSASALLYRIIRCAIARRVDARVRALAAPEVPADEVGKSGQVSAEVNLRDLERRILELVRPLPEQRRRAVQVAMHNDWDARIVAAELGIPYHTSRWILNDVKQYLAEMLERDGYAIPRFRSGRKGEIQ